MQLIPAISQQVVVLSGAGGQRMSLTFGRNAPMELLMRPVQPMALRIDGKAVPMFAAVNTTI